MDFNQLWQIFIVGFAILAGAIIINAFAGLLGMNTWYGFINNIRESGMKAVSKEGFNLIFLFIIYPFLLGCIGYFMTKIW